MNTLKDMFWDFIETISVFLLQTLSIVVGILIALYILWSLM